MHRSVRANEYAINPPTFNGIHGFLDQGALGVCPIFVLKRTAPSMSGDDDS